MDISKRLKYYNEDQNVKNIQEKYFLSWPYSFFKDRNIDEWEKYFIAPENKKIWTNMKNAIINWYNHDGLAEERSSRLLLLKNSGGIIMVQEICSEIGVQKITTKNMDKFIQKSYEKPILIDFYYDECAPCMDFAPLIDELSYRIKNEAIIGKFDIYEYKDCFSDLKTKYSMFSNVDRFPYVVVIYKGNIVRIDSTCITCKDWWKKICEKKSKKNTVDQISIVVDELKKLKEGK